MPPTNRRNDHLERSRDVVSFLLAYGYEPHTTAIHLKHAMERRPDVRLSRDQRAKFLLWVESGQEWMPSVDQLAAQTSGAWLIDTHRGTRWRATAATAFDVAFTAQFNAVEPVRAKGVPCEWLPLAAPRELCGLGLDLADRDFDVAFVGQCPPGSLRAKVLAALRQRFSFAPVDGFLPPDRMMDLYRSARIVVNLPWAGDLNMRTFEAVGAGALLVTGPAHKVNDVLPQDSFVLVESEDPQSWVQAVEHALSDDGLQARAEAAYEHIMALHTYDHRAETIRQVLADAPRRHLTRSDRATALAAAYARWGRLDALGRLPLSPAGRWRSTAEALAWRGLIVANRQRRRLRERSAAGTR